MGLGPVLVLEETPGHHLAALGPVRGQLGDHESTDGPAARCTTHLETRVCPEGHTSKHSTSPEGIKIEHNASPAPDVNGPGEWNAKLLDSGFTGRSLATFGNQNQNFHGTHNELATLEGNSSSAWCRHIVRAWSCSMHVFFFVVNICT